MNRSFSLLLFVFFSSLIFLLQATAQQEGVIIIIASVEGEVIYQTSPEAPAQVANNGMRLS